VQAPPAVTWDEELAWADGPRAGIIDHVRDGRHHFWLEEADGGQHWVVWDGERQGPFEIVPQAGGRPFVWGPDLRFVGAIVRTGGGAHVWADGRLGPGFEDVVESVGITWSRDGRRHAYGALVQGRPRLVESDGSMSEGLLAPAPAVFSPDGARLAWTEAQAADSPGARRRIVVDGMAGPWVPDVSAGVTGRLFSPDSQRFAYLVIGPEARFVVDGVDGTAIHSARDAGWSGDSGRFLYVAGLEDGWALVDEGAPGTRYEAIGAVTANDAATRFAWCAQRGRRWTVVVDGVEGAWFDKTALPRFLTDGRITCVAASPSSGLLGKWRKPWRVLVDGEPADGIEWDSVGAIVPLPAGRFAYGASRGRRRHLVIAGKPGPVVEQIGFVAPSAAGRVAYTAVVRGRATVMVGEEPLRAVSAIGGPDPEHVLRWDARGRLLWVAKLEDGHWHPMVDDAAGPAFDRVTAPWTDEDGSVRFSGLRGRQVWVVRART
jgi:hypothetical protein